MNKAFVREPDFGGRAFCPRCGTEGIPVTSLVLDTHIRSESRSKMQDSAWYCNFARCDVAYFDLLEEVISTEELQTQAYPYDLEAPLCVCFGFTYDEVEADVADGTPTRIRQLLAKSQSSAADCQRLAVDGRCCMSEVQKLYMQLRES